MSDAPTQLGGDTGDTGRPQRARRPPQCPYDDSPATRGAVATPTPSRSAGTSKGRGKASKSPATSSIPAGRRVYHRASSAWCSSRPRGARRPSARRGARGHCEADDSRSQGDEGGLLRVLQREPCQCPRHKPHAWCVVHQRLLSRKRPQTTCVTCLPGADCLLSARSLLRAVRGRSAAFENDTSGARPSRA